MACSLYAVTFGVFLTQFLTYGASLTHEFVLFGFLTPILSEKVLATLMVALFAYINYRGAEETGKAGVVVTAIKVAILGVFVAFGILATVNTPGWPQKFLNSPSFAPNGIVGIVGATGFTYIAFEGVDVHTELLTGDDVVGTLVSEAAGYDVTIIGATRESLLNQLVSGAIPEEVGRHADSTVIMAKRNLGLRSCLSRWVRGYST